MVAMVLFTTADRDDCHKQLEIILAKGEYPKAECREADENGDYTIWSGPQRDGGETIVTVTPEVALVTALTELDGAQLSKLADLIAARMKGG